MVCHTNPAHGATVKKAIKNGEWVANPTGPPKYVGNSIPRMETIQPPTAFPGGGGGRSTSSTSSASANSKNSGKAPGKSSSSNASKAKAVPRGRLAGSAGATAGSKAAAKAAANLVKRKAPENSGGPKRKKVQ